MILNVTCPTAENMFTISIGVWIWINKEGTSLMGDLTMLSLCRNVSGVYFYTFSVFGLCDRSVNFSSVAHTVAYMELK